MCIYGMFSHFLINFLFFENFDKKAKKKKSLIGQNFRFFLAKNAKIFKNQKLLKKVRKHSLDTCI